MHHKTHSVYLMYLKNSLAIPGKRPTAIGYVKHFNLYAWRSEGESSCVLQKLRHSRDMPDVLIFPWPLLPKTTSYTMTEMDEH